MILVYQFYTARNLILLTEHLILDNTYFKPTDLDDRSLFSTRL